MTPVVILALLASLIYGASDFLGALSARRLTVITASTVIYLAGTVIGAVALALLPWVASDRAFWAGAIAGLFSIVGMVTFYAALAIGPMSLLAPLIALIQAAVPVIAAAALGQSLRPVAWFAVVLALVATTLISVPGGWSMAGRRIDRISGRGGMLALIAGVTLGLSVVALDTAPPDSGVYPAFIDLAAGLVVLLPLLAVRRLRVSDGWLKGQSGTVPAIVRSARTDARSWVTSAAGGALLGAGNVLLVLALHGGNLAVVAVLVSLYPLATVILARLVLKERMSVLQFVGVALAIVAAVLLGTA